MNEHHAEQKLIPSQFQSEDEWVAYYTKSHLSAGFDYRESHLPYLVIDGLLEKYNLLEIGCGTAGYLKLLKNLDHFTGIDWSEKMVNVARKLNPEHEFTAVLFEDFQSQKTFDVIIDFVTGMYDRPSQKNIDKIFSLLNKNGIAVISVRAHRITLKERIGDVIRRRKNLKISEREMQRICEKWNKLFSISKRSGSLDIEIYFLQKP